MVLLLVFFPPSRGLGQGDPISLTLFTIYFDVIYKFLSRVEEDDNPCMVPRLIKNSLGNNLQTYESGGGFWN